MKNPFLILFIGILVFFHLDVAAQINFEAPEENPAFYKENRDKIKLKMAKLIPYKRQKLWGYADSTGVIRVAPKYQHAEPIYAGVARVMLNNLYGLVNDKGKEVLAPQFDKIEKFDGQLATVVLNGKQGVINKGGEIIVPAIYSSALPLRDAYNKLTNYVVVYNYERIVPDLPGVTHEAYKQVYGLFDAAGKEIRPLMYSGIRAIGDGVVRISIGKTFSYIDDKGETIIKEVTYFADKQQDGVAVVHDEGRKYGYMDRTGKLIIPILYEAAFDFENGFAAAKLNSKVGLINKQNEIIIPFLHQSLQVYPDDKIVLAYKDGKMGVLGLDGSTLIDFQFRQIQFDDKDKLFTLYSPDFLSTGGKKGLSCAFLNQQQQLAFIEDVYIDYQDNFSDGIIKAKSIIDKKVGFIDRSGKTVIPFIYDDAQSTKDGLVAVKKDQLYGLIDLKNRVVIPITYGYLKVVSSETFLVKSSPNSNSKKSYYGLINKQGEALTPIHFKYIEPFINGKAVANLDGNLTIINTAGKQLVPLTNLPTGTVAQSGVEQGIFLVSDTNGFQFGYADIYGRLYF
ncbi:WG repeat-containing protein [Pontibacter sp. MBLB2868]|uniref:WG repeat-containing protein n=1 Tax=Pontibacter sp. MBLB2868 TaxID=3451555 RepID=UPI003F7503FD